MAMKKFDELFTAKVKQLDPKRYPFEFTWTALFKKTRLHYIDTQRTAFDLKTGVEVGIFANPDPELRQKIDLNTVTLFPDTGLPGMYKMHKFTHNVYLCYKAKNGRIVAREIHVRVTKRWAVDMYGRRFSRKTGECFDDEKLWIETSTAKPWSPIYE
jgi:hypothetical protein